MIAEPNRQLTFSQDRFLEVVSRADALYRLETRKTDRAVISKIQETSPEDLSLDRMIAIAQEVEIPQKYIELAVDQYFPSAEQQLADVLSQGAVPSPQVILRTYEVKLLESLQRNLPLEHVVMGKATYEDGTYDPDWRKGAHNDNIFHFFRVSEREEKSKFLFLERKSTRKEYSKFAEISFASSGRAEFILNGQLYDPLFLRACGETIRELNDHFKEFVRQGKMTYHYVI